MCNNYVVTLNKPTPTKKKLKLKYKNNKCTATTISHRPTLQRKCVVE